MRVDNSWWLKHCKQLPINTSRRIRHYGTAEHRDNVVIINDPTQYRMHCFACNSTEVVNKVHVPVVDSQTTYNGAYSTELKLEFTPYNELDAHWRSILDSFTVSKCNIAAEDFPDSCVPGRLNAPNKTGYIGFKLGGGYLIREYRNKIKWYTYKNPQKFIHQGSNGWIVLVEDILSAVKVAKALPEYSVLALCGTKAHISDIAEVLLHKNCVVMLDGDNPGIKAGEALSHRIRNLGINTMHVLLASGDDPKDLTIQRIREIVDE